VFPDLTGFISWPLAWVLEQIHLRCLWLILCGTEQWRSVLCF
jgi:hypothetical protein